jgi:hypothetical protein
MGRAHHAQVDVEMLDECALHQVPLVLPQQPVVDEDADHAIGNGPMHQ